MAGLTNYCDGGVYGRLREVVGYPTLLFGIQQKKDFLNKRLYELNKLHLINCKYYANMIESLGIEVEKNESYYHLPFLPVRLFKEMELRSISKEEVYKTITSSGTSGQEVSKIYLY